ncbi:MAG: hypothetical protein CSA55_04750 [Ilumatobacter coccineus]|uniref:SGNH hydrolase-type esterase domain-containing protein n=1 Tax=Ilumatobacter coccineus TaxID=467094 RepID=A0A2G6K7X3_9ACTN|nr:MAG: hypothetical protein CSA55_04750 [Ilumatobacter coccineus]
MGMRRVALVFVVIMIGVLVSTQAGETDDALSVTRSAALGDVSGSDQMPVSSVTPVTTAVPSSTVAPVIVPRSVVVVGDSLTASAQGKIEDRIAAAGHTVVAIDAVSGRRMASGSHRVNSGIDAIRTLQAQGVAPEIWVIALGTNDLGDSGIGFAQAMQAVVDFLPDGVTVVWVDTWIEGRDAEVERANQNIVEIADKNDIFVVEWSDRGTEPGFLISDGVHLTEAGKDAFADQIVAGINAVSSREPVVPAPTSTTAVESTESS